VEWLLHNRNLFAHLVCANHNYEFYHRLLDS
jgi:hypothetical protein